MVHLFIGFSVVATHSVWGSLLAVLVTLTGSSFVVRGVTYYWVPRRCSGRRTHEQRASAFSAPDLAALGGGYLGFGSQDAAAANCRTRRA
jgi:hypothetical protein